MTPNKGQKYRSKLESFVGSQLDDRWSYEPFQVPYVIRKKYTPDFVSPPGDWGKILVEVKGFFRTGDTQKYKAIHREVTEQGDEFVFYLQSPDKKVRKGASLSMSQWCDKEGIRWFANTDALEEYVNGHF